MWKKVLVVDLIDSHDSYTYQINMNFENHHAEFLVQKMAPLLPGSFGTGGRSRACSACDFKVSRLESRMEATIARIEARLEGLWTLWPFVQYEGSTFIYIYLSLQSYKHVSKNYFRIVMGFKTRF